jgi:hypothetical protein
VSAKRKPAALVTIRAIVDTAAPLTTEERFERNRARFLAEMQTPDRGSALKFAAACLAYAARPSSMPTHDDDDSDEPIWAYWETLSKPTQCAHATRAIVSVAEARGLNIVRRSVDSQ